MSLRRRFRPCGTFFPAAILSVAGFILYIVLKHTVQQQRAQIGIPNSCDDAPARFGGTTSPTLEYTAVETYDTRINLHQWAARHAALHEVEASTPVTRAQPPARRGELALEQRDRDITFSGVVLRIALHADRDLAPLGLKEDRVLAARAPDLPEGLSVRPGLSVDVDAGM